MFHVLVTLSPGKLPPFRGQMLGFELFEEAMTVDNVPTSLPSAAREAPYDIMTIGLKFCFQYDVKEKWTTSRGMIEQ
jgi:hypothetical protein